jgi:RNA polymerase sigma-70 factor, ECF subfamily
MTPADGELVLRVLAGHRDDYALLIRRHQDRLYRYGLGMAGDPDVAADLVQDSFVKAYVSLATCRDPDRFGAWVFRIARNRCADYLKEHRRRDVPLDLAPRLPAAADRPDRDLDRGELRRAMEEALAGLPEAQREAFLLKHVEGLGYEEIAELLGVGVSALKMRVARARESLRAALEEIGYRRERAM